MVRLIDFSYTKDTTCIDLALALIPDWEFHFISFQIELVIP